MKKKLVVIIIIFISINFITGCSSSNSSIQEYNLYTGVNLKSQYTYPMAGVKVNASEKKSFTNHSGKVKYKLNEGQYKISVKSYIKELYKDISLNSDTTLNIDLNLPDNMNEEHLKYIIFWYNSTHASNFRWEVEELKLYFDYSKSDKSFKSDWEKRAMQEINEWAVIKNLSFKKSKERKSADIIVYYMNEKNFFKEHPDENNSTIGWGGCRIASDHNYITEGYIHIRDEYALYPGIYSHEMGHVLGFGHPFDLYSTNSIMSYDDSIENLTTIDKQMLKIKMNLPPMISYSLGTSAYKLTDRTIEVSCEINDINE